MVLRKKTIGLCVAFVSMAWGSGALAGESNLLTNVDGRKAVSLNGEWHTIVDPYETGYYDYRRQPNKWGYFKNAKPKDKAELIEYDFDASPTLTVPGDWNTQRPELLYYEGTVWYKTAFDCSPAADRRVFLHFAAANYDARAYLNGELLGRHVGGFTPFQFEITGKTRPQDNCLVVKVDNTRRADAVPTVNTDWWNYGGLTRRVLLVETPQTFVRDYVVQLDPAEPDTIAGWVQLDGSAAAAQTVHLEIPEAGLSGQVQTDATGRAAFRIAAPDIERWSPENPRLYDVRIAGASDTVTDRIGFRTVSVRGADILLNGESVFLRGICLHEERPLGGGRAHSPEHAQRLLSWAKDLNCNFVRLAHYPHNEAMLREADRIGLLVWAEIPVYWTIAFDNEAVYRNAENQLTEMIARDRNRACIGLWSVANETPRSEPRLRFLRRLVDEAHRLDPTRLVTAALETHYRDANTIEINDPLGAHLDVLGCNEYVGWYDGPPAKADGLRWITSYDKPLVISEFGAGARQGHHGDEGARWTEEYQAAVYRHQTAMLDRIDFLRGVSPWILVDFRSPRRVLPVIQDGWNRKGLISDDGIPKPAFDVLKAWYAKKAKTTADSSPK